MKIILFVLISLIIVSGCTQGNEPSSNLGGQDSGTDISESEAIDLALTEYFLKDSEFDGSIDDYFNKRINDRFLDITIQELKDHYVLESNKNIFGNYLILVLDPGIECGSKRFADEFEIGKDGSFVRLSKKGEPCYFG